MTEKLFTGIISKIQAKEKSVLGDFDQVYHKVGFSKTQEMVRWGTGGPDPILDFPENGFCSTSTW